jgi:hypothetical protein
MDQPGLSRQFVSLDHMESDFFPRVFAEGKKAVLNPESSPFWYESIAMGTRYRISPLAHNRVIRECRRYINITKWPAKNQKVLNTTESCP